MQKEKLLLIVLMAFPFLAEACDPCALFTASRLQGHKGDSFLTSLSKQYTSFNKTRHLADNSMRDGEFVRSMGIIQAGLGYDLTDKAGIQILLPFVHRRYDQIKGYRNRTTSEEGIGDISLLGGYTLIDSFEGDTQSRMNIFAGIKFPTGDTGALERTVADPSLRTHGGMGGSSGGRILSLGSGSTDYTAGLNGILRYEKFFLMSQAQYTMTTEGDFDYQFGDSAVWSVGPGYYITSRDENSLAVRVAFTLEHKEKDRESGVERSGSAVTNVFAGPEIIFTIGENVAAELASEIELSSEEKEALVVPDYRLRAGIIYRF